MDGLSSLPDLGIRPHRLTASVARKKKMVVKAIWFLAGIDSIVALCKGGAEEAEVFHVLSAASMCTNHEVSWATLKRRAGLDSGT